MYTDDWGAAPERKLLTLPPSMRGVGVCLCLCVCVCVIHKYRRQGRGARKEDFDVAAQHALELVEEDLVPKRRAPAGAHGSFGCGKPRLKDSLRDPPLGFHHSHDLVVDTRVHARHAGHNGGLQSRDVFSNKLSRITLKEANGGAAQEQQHLCVELKAISISI